MHSSGGLKSLLTLSCRATNGSRDIFIHMTISDFLPAYQGKVSNYNRRMQMLCILLLIRFSEYAGFIFLETFGFIEMPCGNP